MSEPKPTYTAGQPRRTTVAILPDDSMLIEATRLWLQKLYGTDHSKADAVHYAMLNLTKTNPSILEMLDVKDQPQQRQE